MPRKSTSTHESSGAPHRGRSAVVGEGRRIINMEPESPTTRVIRNQQRVRWGFRVGVAILVVFGLMALIRATVQEAFVKNPRFSLRQIVVNTEGSLTPQRIVRTTGLTEGQNLLTINLREVRERIEQLPEVRKATIARDYDGRLTIEVQQRHPVAWIECAKLKLEPMRSGHGWLVDEEGVAIPCEVVIKSYLNLPVIRVDELNQVTPGVEIQSMQFKASLKLLAEMSKRTDDHHDQITLIHVPNPYALVTKFNDGMTVTFGMDGLEEQISRFTRIKREGNERGWRIATLNLLVKDNVPVTFKSKIASVPSAIPVTNVSPPESSQRSRSRRNP